MAVIEIKCGDAFAIEISEEDANGVLLDLPAQVRCTLTQKRVAVAALQWTREPGNQKKGWLTATNGTRHWPLGELRGDVVLVDGEDANGNPIERTCLEELVVMVCYRGTP